MKVLVTINCSAKRLRACCVGYALCISSRASAWKVNLGGGGLGVIK